MQKEMIRRYCYAARVREGSSLLEPGQEPLWYVDQAVSGKTLLREREAGGAMLQHLKAGDHLVIAKLDRAFRKASDCLNMLDWCERAGVHLHVTDLYGIAIDITQHIGKFILTIIAAVAELERNYASERTIEGIKLRRRRGDAHGRSHYGFKYEKRRRKGRDGEWEDHRKEVPDPEERAAMGLFLQWKQQGMTWGEIYYKAKEMKLTHRGGKEWNFTSIRNATKAEAILQFKEKMDGVSEVAG